MGAALARFGLGRADPDPPIVALHKQRAGPIGASSTALPKQRQPGLPTISRASAHRRRHAEAGYGGCGEQIRLFPADLAAYIDASTHGAFLASQTIFAQASGCSDEAFGLRARRQSPGARTRGYLHYEFGLTGLRKRTTARPTASKSSAVSPAPESQLN